MPDPLISVVVPTRDRAIRLRWLLNALADQTLDIGRLEVIVANGSRTPETSAMLRRHRLTEAGVLRELLTAQASLPVQRDLGWRAARAPVVIFTDDDCRPPGDWLERALEASEQSPGAVIQGRTLPDPDEIEILYHAPHARTQRIIPPTIWAQTCNIVYPRALLEAISGFDIHWPANFAGDDTDIAQRAIAGGAEYRAAPAMLTYHAVHDGTLVDRIRSGWRWGDLPYLVKRHPQLRAHLPLRYFWKPSHALMTLALGGLLISPRRRAAVLAAAPWAWSSAPDYASSLRGRVRGVLELPGHAVIDLTEMVAFLRGSFRHRTLLL